MPKDLSDDKTKFPTAVRVPVDGDDANGANFELPYQQLADRTAYLREETEGQGVRRIRHAGKLDALRTIVPVMQLEMRWVDGYGLFAYDQTLAGPEQLPWRVMSTVAVGGWFNVMFALRSEVGRAAYTNLTPRNVPSSSASVSNDVPGMSVTLPDAGIGQRLVVTFHGLLGSNGGLGIFRLVVSENGGPGLELPETGVAITTGTRSTVAWTAMHTVTTAGPLVVKLVVQNDAGATSTMHRPTCLVAQLIRF
jgi:hypothetical protein